MNVWVIFRILYCRVGSVLRMRFVCAPIAQLDRASGYEPGGRKFESCWAHQNCHPFNDLQRRHSLAPIYVMPIVT